MQLELPVEAIQNEVARIPLPSNLEKNGQYFGLKVQGDSMIEAGINEGDTVLLKDLILQIMEKLLLL